MCETVKARTIQFIKQKGITKKFFEEKCGLSTGYVTSMRKGFGNEKLNNVLQAFPELNRDWLLYGEGDMLLGDVSGSNNAIGRESVVNVNESETISNLIAVIKKEQEQIDRMLSIIEDLTGKIK